MTTEGIDVRSVGNSLILHETALVEAFNLKAAIEYQLKNCKHSEANIGCWTMRKVFILYPVYAVYIIGHNLSVGLIS